ncbi:MAG: DMT family transporter [Rhodoferax sp.]
MKANLYALGAIALWASLATLGMSLSHVPPFLLTGVALLVGSFLSVPLARFDLDHWRVPGSTLLLGVYGLFGYHFLLFMALQHAPPVEANLVNYLWPLLMVVLAPVLLRAMRLRAAHVLAALLGFAGAAVTILGAQGTASGAAAAANTAWGYAAALAAALVWSSYSLLCQRVQPFPTAAIGLFGLVSGLLSLLCHWALEPSIALDSHDWLLLVALGLGPLGAAFFLWDKALKLGDARQIGILSYLTPLASTSLLLLFSGRAFTWNIGLAAALILGAAWLGTRASNGPGR